jgi:large subunit ribosomal protein L13
MNTQRMTKEIDASGKAPGRLAAEVARVLMGKHKASYEPRIDGGDCVVVKNASKMVFTGRKLAQKDYRHHSMYPGGLKRKSVAKVFALDPAEVVRHAVNGMLPKNRRRTTLMKRLTIHA